MTRLRLAAAETGWWLRGLYGLVRPRPVKVLVWLVLAFLVLVWAGWSAAAAVLAPLVAVSLSGGVWARWWPVSFHRRWALPRWRSWTRRRVQRLWPEVMAGCHLTRPGKDAVRVPALDRVWWDRQGQLHLTPSLLVGQTVDDLEASTDRLRTSLGAHRLRVQPNPARTSAELVAMFGDPLAQPFDTALPEVGTTAAVTAPDQVVLGLTEDGTPWTVDLRVSTLTAGSTGSGKGSVIWSLMTALAPAIRAGLVEVHGIDLKNGMELSLGARMFTRYAARPDLAVALLEDAVTACEARAEAMAGLSRNHVATVDAPLVLVLIDELAMLTSYVPDRDLLRRGEQALARLCSIGRAPGFFVWGFLQDPRKETIKARHLFTQTIGLRLRDREEVAMIHGDGALNAGAACHRIDRGTPGVGYAQDDTGRLVRVRAGRVDDDIIRTLAERFPTPRVIPVELPPPEDEPDKPVRTRRPRVKVGDVS